MRRRTGRIVLQPWPIIARFIASLSTGWIGLDSGTGNGKYLPLPLERPGAIWTIGLDRSRNLLEIARKAGEGDVTREVVWGNVLDYPWRDGAFVRAMWLSNSHFILMLFGLQDYAISIATIHHLSTVARRKVAVQVCSRMIQVNLEIRTGVLSVSFKASRHPMVVLWSTCGQLNKTVSRRGISRLNQRMLRTVQAKTSLCHGFLHPRRKSRNQGRGEEGDKKVSLVKTQRRSKKKRKMNQLRQSLTGTIICLRRVNFLHLL